MAEGGAALQLTAPEARVLGALIEKQLTTPDAYPLTLNALTTACNQTSARDPVVRYQPREVESTVLALKAKRVVRVVHPGAGERATRYRQVLDELLSLDGAERALLCVLLLRGPQTASELKVRTERLHPFAAAGEVEAALEALADQETPLVARVDRLPGQKEGRWIQLLELGASERAAAASRATVTPSGGPGSRVEELEVRVAALEARLAAVVESLGDLVDVPPAARPGPVEDGSAGAGPVAPAS
jgi:uncharacterized protein YceH (UPF0502 family)